MEIEEAVLTSVDLIDIPEAVHLLQQGEIILYPTEAVYGIGCDPSHLSAVKKIIEYKQRPLEKGFILIASNWQQLQDWILPVPEEYLENVFVTWPGPFTWLFPVRPEIDPLITGHRQTIAVRISAHPVVQTLCTHWGKPIISTSANISHQPTAKTIEQLIKYFPYLGDHIVAGRLGGLQNPTPIRDVLSGEAIRE